MKLLVPIFLLVVLFGCKPYGPLHHKVIKQPNGVTFAHYDVPSDTCTAEIFVGERLKILTPCRSKGDTSYFDISAETADVDRIRELLTFELVDSLRQCCTSYDCKDEDRGYTLIVHEGDRIEVLDLGYRYSRLHQCGNKDILEIREIFYRLVAKYR